MVELGDVRKFDEHKLTSLRQQCPRAEIVLVIGGSLCQGLSKLNADKKGMADERTLLFFEFVCFTNLISQVWPGAKAMRVV